MSKKYEIAKMHICGFEMVRDCFSANLEKYPTRLCVLDREGKRVIDVKTGHEYPYLKVINMTYISNENDNIKVEPGKRYGCIEYLTLLSLELSSDELRACQNILELLKNGYKFKDGNSELTNEQYLKMINSVQKEEKSVKKLKKRK